jgi:hypothetical protein
MSLRPTPDLFVSFETITTGSSDLRSPMCETSASHSCVTETTVPESALRRAVERRQRSPGIHHIVKSAEVHRSRVRSGRHDVLVANAWPLHLIAETRPSLHSRCSRHRIHPGRVGGTSPLPLMASLPGGAGHRIATTAFMLQLSLRRAFDRYSQPAARREHRRFCGRNIGRNEAGLL